MFKEMTIFEQVFALILIFQINVTFWLVLSMCLDKKRKK